MPRRSISSHFDRPANVRKASKEVVSTRDIKVGKVRTSPIHTRYSDRTCFPNLTVVKQAAKVPNEPNEPDAAKYTADCYGRFRYQWNL